MKNFSPPAIQFKWEEPHYPESVCSVECELGQAKQYVEGESCCWHCFNCTQYEVFLNKITSIITIQVIHTNFIQL